jgi:hypothetical protein
MGRRLGECRTVICWGDGLLKDGCELASVVVKL